jgi:hypothetical protein
VLSIVVYVARAVWCASASPVCSNKVAHCENCPRRSAQSPYAANSPRPTNRAALPNAAARRARLTNCAALPCIVANSPRPIAQRCRTPPQSTRRPIAQHCRARPQTVHANPIAQHCRARPPNAHTQPIALRCHALPQGMHAQPIAQVAPSAAAKCPLTNQFHDFLGWSRDTPDGGLAFGGVDGSRNGYVNCAGVQSARSCD